METTPFRRANALALALECAADIAVIESAAFQSVHAKARGRTVDTTRETEESYVIWYFERDSSDTQTA